MTNRYVRKHFHRSARWPGYLAVVNRQGVSTGGVNEGAGIRTATIIGVQALQHPVVRDLLIAPGVLLLHATAGLKTEIHDSLACTQPDVTGMVPDMLHHLQVYRPDRCHAEARHR